MRSIIARTHAVDDGAQELHLALEVADPLLLDAGRLARVERPDEDGPECTEGADHGFTCVSSSDDPDQLGDEPDIDEPAASEPDPIARRWDGGGEAPGEIIRIEDGAPGSQGGGWGRGHSGANSHPDNGGGGGATGNSAIQAQPQKRNCDQEQDPEACKQCCDWNADKHDAWACNRLPKRTKEQKQAKADCWKKLEADRSKCYGKCPRVIIYYPALGVSQ